MTSATPSLPPIQTGSLSHYYKPELSPQLNSIIVRAIANIPHAYREPPQAGDVIPRDQALERLQAYAFTQGYALVTESSANNRLRLACIHHRASTRNTRRLDDDVREGGNRKRKWEAARLKARGCPYAVYIAYSKRKDHWRYGVTNPEHNHAPVANPFNYHVHRKRADWLAEGKEEGRDPRWKGSLKILNEQPKAPFPPVPFTWTKPRKQDIYPWPPPKISLSNATSPVDESMESPLAETPNYDDNGDDLYTVTSSSPSERSYSSGPSNGDRDIFPGSADDSPTYGGHLPPFYHRPPPPTSAMSLPNFLSINAPSLRSP